MALLVGLPAAAYTLHGARWPGDSVELHVDLDFQGGHSASGVSWNQAFAESASLWNQASGFRVELTPVRSDPCAGVARGIPQDGFRNGVGFAPDVCGVAFGAGTLAVTTSYSQNGRLLEADVVFNSLRSWDIYEGPWENAADFRRVAVHELGHVLGLGHENRAASIMASTIPMGSTVEQPLEDDISGVAALYGTAEPSLPPLVLNLEEPVAGEVRAGVGNLRGWVVSLAGVERVELLIDGVEAGLVPTGGRRGDVASAFAEYPDSLQSGFSMAFAYNALVPGEHTITLRATSRDGSSIEDSATFQVVRFQEGFIHDPAQVSLAGATISHDASTLAITHLRVAGRPYHVTLRWRTASQGFEIVAIEPAAP